MIGRIAWSQLNSYYSDDRCVLILFHWNLYGLFYILFRLTTQGLPGLFTIIPLLGTPSYVVMEYIWF